MELAFGFTQVAGVADTVTSQFGDFSFHSGTFAIAFFELGGLLSLAGCLQVVFVEVGGDGASVGFAMHTTREEWAGFANFS